MKVQRELWDQGGMESKGQALSPTDLMAFPTWSKVHTGIKSNDPSSNFHSTLPRRITIDYLSRRISPIAQTNSAEETMSSRIV